MITIRPTTDPDAAAIQQIIQQVFAEYPGCLFDLAEMPELIAPATAFRELNGSFWLAELAAHIVGCIALIPTPDPSLVELKKLYTLPSVRGQGLGRRLIELVEAEARIRQAQRVHLWTDTRFITAHRVYERLGYARLPETRDLHDISNSIEYHYEKTF